MLTSNSTCPKSIHPIWKSGQFGRFWTPRDEPGGRRGAGTRVGVGEGTAEAEQYCPTPTSRGELSRKG